MIWKFKHLYLPVVALTLVATGCSKDDDDDNTTPSTTYVELTGDLTSQRLTADKKYLLKGQVFVRNGQTLTIDPGTVIFGEKRSKGTLIIDRGGKIHAEGTVNNPIVLTSDQSVGTRDRGDWGGLLILGNASVNQVDPAIEGIDPAAYFGGNAGNVLSTATPNDDDNSGTLKYVRVEFAGIELTPNNETNSITLGGVGRGTVMEYCQVSFGGDDGFEWFGGTVNAKNLIVFNTWDDDFDVDYGYSGNVQFGLAIRYPSYADQSGSNAFECDNGPNDNDVTPYTTGTFSNITAIGPIRSGSSTSNSNFQHSLDLRRRTAVSITNSVLIGFPRGIRMNQASVLAQYQGGTGVLHNNIVVTPGGSNAVLAGSGVDAADILAYWNANSNTMIEGAISDASFTSLGLNPNIAYGSGMLATAYPEAPTFTVTNGTLATGADFTIAKFNEANRSSFFQHVAYRGAFGSTDWTSGWAEFRPVDANY